MLPTDDILPPATGPVAAHTADEVNRRIRRRTEAAVADFADHPEEIGRRLDELDREWDISGRSRPGEKR